MRILVALIALAFLAGCMGDDIRTRSHVDTPDFQPNRGPIRIYSDDDLTLENGVRGGQGLPEDPYRIEGWSLHAPHDGPAIKISNVHKHVVIKDCKIKAAKHVKAIHISKSKNVHMRNCTVVVQVDGGITPAMSTPTTGSSHLSTASSPNTGASSTSTSPAATSANEVSTTITSDQAAASDGILIHVEDAENTTIGNTTLVGGAIVLTNATTTTLHDSTISHAQESGRTGGAITVFGSQDLRVVNASVNNGGSDGLHISNSSHVEIVGSNITGVEGTGVQIIDSTHLTLIGSTIVESAGDGIHLQNVADANVTQIVSASNGGFGVAASGSELFVTNSTVTGNGQGGAGGGILVSGEDIVVSRNEVKYNSGYAVVVMPGSSGTSVVDNEIQGEDRGKQIVVPAPANRNQISQDQGEIIEPAPGFDPRAPIATEDRTYLVLMILGALGLIGLGAILLYRRKSVP